MNKSIFTCFALNVFTIIILGIGQYIDEKEIARQRQEIDQIKSTISLLKIQKTQPEIKVENKEFKDLPKGSKYIVQTRTDFDSALLQSLDKEEFIIAYGIPQEVLWDWRTGYPVQVP